MIRFESHNGNVNINFTGDSDTLAAELADLLIAICHDGCNMHYFMHLVDGVQATLKKMKEIDND